MILSFLLNTLLPAAFAHATWPGRDGAIAFTRDAHIWVQLPNGTQRQLTSGGPPTPNRPTRGTGAFVRYDGSDADIWVMGSDGTDQRPVTQTDGPLLSEVQPAFFPGGRSLVFAQSNLPTGWTVFSIRLDGSGNAERRSIRCSRS